MGMDWHSSGITTSVMGALKRGVNPHFDELGIAVCGGRGRRSQSTPDELCNIAMHTGLNGGDLAHTSRLVARVDNNAVADGFQVYLHSFVVLKSGAWAVVQQGMNPASGLARRYHWHSPEVSDFTSDPHSAIVGQDQGAILNLVTDGPQQHALSVSRGSRSKLTEFRKLIILARHNVRAKDVDLKRLGAVLALAYDQDLSDFGSLLLVEGLGPRTLQSLALVAEIIHGAPTRFADPARFTLAHGGKDGRSPTKLPSN